MKIVKLVSFLIILVILGGWVVIRSLTVYIPVGSVGVRTQEYGILGKKGVVPKDFGPGWHRDLGPVDSWMVFDATVQTLEMTRDSGTGSRRVRDDVQVQSSDGYSVSVDVTVKYRIQEGKAHKVYQDTGSRGKYKTIVRNEAMNACMSVFGEMRTEDFYSPAERRRSAVEAHEKLATALQRRYVEVVDVLIRDVQFDPAYEDKIRRKKLADQEVELNKSAARAAEMRGKTEVIEADITKQLSIIAKEKEAALVRLQAQTDLEIATIKANADKYATQKKADADLVKAQKESDGHLLVKRAEAEGERLRNAAMTGVGGSVIVALEAARSLNLSDLTISTVETDLLDIDKMATKLGVPEQKVPYNR